MAVTDRDGRVVAERSTADTMRHAEVIGGFLADCLGEAGVRPAELEAVAVGMGPGPFTGLRVGIAAARTFALAAGIPVLPVVSHDAIAFARYGAGAVGGILVVTDARRRERYWSAYLGVDADGLPVREDGPGLARPDELPHPQLERCDATDVPAGALAGFAERMRAAGRPFAEDRPLYLRSPDVTLSAGPKRVSR